LQQYLHINKLSITTFELFKKVESFQTPRIIWLIRLIWPHLLLDQAATGAVW